MSHATAPIPFTRSAVVGREREYVSEAIESGQLSGDGPFTQRCSLLLRAELEVERALLTTSCTHALEMAALLLDIEPGDEIIVPSFTFVSAANAFVLRGARPIFIDSRADTLNMDESLLDQLITDRTRAIVAVHYAGVGCEMDRIMEIANARGVPVVEDNAHGLFGQYRGRWLGTFGRFATLSFHGTKNFSCGEGGALLIKQPGDVERAEIIREKGTDRSRFVRGEVDKYSWTDVGSSYLPSEILAAYLLGQLEAKIAIQSGRRAVCQTYDTELRGWAATVGITLPLVPKHCDPSWHMFYLLLPTASLRQNLVQHLRQRGITASPHYVPLHTSQMGKRLGARDGSLPVSESAAERILRLPLYNDMTPADVQRVITALHAWK